MTSPPDDPALPAAVQPSVLVQSGRTARDEPDVCGDLTATGTLLARLHAVPLAVLTCELPVRTVADDLRGLACRAAALRASGGSSGGAATDPRGPIVTDLDGVVAGAAARDLGYLLAYLRPHQLTSGRAGQAVFVAHEARSTLVAGPTREYGPWGRNRGRRPIRCNSSPGRGCTRRPSCTRSPIAG